MQVGKETEVDGEVDVVGIYGFWVNGVNGGWPFPVPALRCARMTGLLFAKAKECHCELGPC